MGRQFRDFMLKSIPYLLSIAGGVVLFIVTKDNLADKELADLVTNIAASLLSIPLVFLLYDYSNSRISSRLSTTLAANMTDKINVLVLNIIMQLRKSVGLRGRATLESLNRIICDGNRTQDTSNTVDHRSLALISYRIGGGGLCRRPVKFVVRPANSDAGGPGARIATYG